MPLLKPTISIVTAVGQDHYTNFRSREATAQEKQTLVRVLPRKGVAILNFDDPFVRPMADVTNGRVIGYGLSADADLRASEISATWPGRLSFNVDYNGEKARVETRLAGEIWLSSALAAIAVGLDLETCAKRMATVEAVPGSMALYKTPAESWFINDTAKAPYWTIELACRTLLNAVSPRKTVVFGPFSDMGGGSSKKYRKAARGRWTLPIAWFLSVRSPVTWSAWSMAMLPVAWYVCLRFGKLPLFWLQINWKARSRWSRLTARRTLSVCLYRSKNRLPAGKRAAVSTAIAVFVIQDAAGQADQSALTSSSTCSTWPLGLVS